MRVVDRWLVFVAGVSKIMAIIARSIAGVFHFMKRLAQWKNNNPIECHELKISTWNVNSLRVRLPQVVDWIALERPNLLALQETKLPDSAFPDAELVALGYHSIHSGQPTYNGVALLSLAPPTEVQIGIPGWDDPQRRLLAASYAAPNLPHGKLRIVNLYAPNGQAVGGDKYAYKLDWFVRLNAWLKEELTIYPNIAVMGDYNIAPEDRDVHDPVAWKGNIAVSAQERSAFYDLLALGFTDAFRLFTQKAHSFSWWDYRFRAFHRNRGLRIDHILLSHPLTAYCASCHIDKGPRHLSRPSDHTPVVAELFCPNTAI
ncbi:exodeoxyribonuclease III [Gammaproteobacteria bacterium]